MLIGQWIKSDHQQRAGATTARRLAMAFVLYGLMATAFLAINMPPFQNPDEPGHFLRAAHLADGGLIGTRFLTADTDGVQRILGGGSVDPALARAWYPFYAISFHRETRATEAMWARRIHWSGNRQMVAFPNTAVNPPLFYGPSAIGVLVGRASRMTVLQTLVLSRLLTGVAAVAVGSAAIACAGGAAVWLFAILTLPMSLSLIASSSQDALLLACSALAGALLVRAFRWPDDRNRKVLTGLAVTLILVATARPPYGALAVLPLGLTAVRLRLRILAAAAVAVFAWSGIAAATALSNAAAYFGADPAMQMERLRSDPLLLVRAVSGALTQYWPQYVEGFIGWLGWQDTELPPIYHIAAWAILAVAAVAAMLGLNGERIAVRSRLVITAGLLLSAAGVFAIEYVAWTAPGSAAVNGVAGRYFLPLALAGAALLPALGDTRWARLHDALVIVVAAFPLVSLAVVMRAVVLRYYLG